MFTIKWTKTDLMSHSQFHRTRAVLRHAWLNLWDKHMTTGRINQIDIQLTLSLPTLTRPKHNAIGRNIFHIVPTKGLVCSLKMNRFNWTLWKRPLLVSYELYSHCFSTSRVRKVQERQVSSVTSDSPTFRALEQCKFSVFHGRTKARFKNAKIVTSTR